MESLSLCLFSCAPSWDEHDRKLVDETEDLDCKKFWRFMAAVTGGVFDDARLLRLTFSRAATVSAVGSLFLRAWRETWGTPEVARLSFLINSSSGVAKTPGLGLPRW